VLELASTIVISNPPLFLVYLVLALTSTIITVPFLALLAHLSSKSSLSSSWIFLGSNQWTSIGVLALWFWTLSILRGIQRVTVSGVAGSYYFDRHSPDRPAPSEITKAALSRASGPSLGTVCGAAFLLAIFELLVFLARKARQVVHSSKLPSIFYPVTFLSPILNIVYGTLDVYSGYALCYAGLTGDSLWVSARKANVLIRKNKTKGLVDNLLVKMILTATSFILSLLVGTLGFLLLSSYARREEASLMPLVALLCFVIPYWSINLCAAIVSDIADTCFLAWNIDLDTKTSHCAQAMDAFGELKVDLTVG